jgi:hypothetical protein
MAGVEFSGYLEGQSKDSLFRIHQELVVSQTQVVFDAFEGMVKHGFKENAEGIYTVTSLEMHQNYLRLEALDGRAHVLSVGKKESLNEILYQESTLIRLSSKTPSISLHKGVSDAQIALTYDTIDDGGNVSLENNGIVEYSRGIGSGKSSYSRYGGMESRFGVPLFGHEEGNMLIVQDDDAPSSSRYELPLRFNIYDKVQEIAERMKS